MIHIMIEIPGSEPEGMELSLRRQEQSGRGLHVGHARISALPFPHDVHILRLAGQAVRVPAERGSKVDGYHHPEGPALADGGDGYGCGGKAVDGNGSI